MNKNDGRDKFFLNKFLQSRSSFDIGQIQFINLELVKEKSGDNWANIRQKIFEVSQFFIEKRIGDDDIVIKCADGFIVLYADARPPGPEIRTKDISDQMNTFFLGEELFRALSVRSSARKVDLASLTSLLADTATAAPADEPKPSPPKPKMPPRPIRQFVFKPVWDSHVQALTTQFCVATERDDHAGIMRSGRDILHGDIQAKDHFKLDMEVWQQASDAFAKLAKEKKRAAICVSVHFLTLSSRDSRLEYFRVISQFPEAMRRYLFLRIDGMTEGTPTGKVQDICRSMAPFSAGLLVHLKFGSLRIASFDAANIRMFGWECPGRNRDFTFSDNQTAQLKTFVAAARRQSADVYLTNVPNFEALRQAMECGVRCFTGAEIGEATDVPVPPCALSLDDIRTASGENFYI